MPAHFHTHGIIEETPGGPIEEPTEYAYGGDLSRPETWTPEDHEEMDRVWWERWEGAYFSVDEEEALDAWLDEVEERRHEYWTDASPR